MPPKKANNRKASAKLAAASADVDVFNNGDKKVVEVIATDAKILPNGELVSDENGSQVSPKLKTTTRNSGRNKNVSDLEAETSLEKMPVTKSRGKKKFIENEVIENENDGSRPETQEVDDTKLNEEIKGKPKLKGGIKKTETKTKSSKANKNKKEETAVGDTEEENQVDEVKVSEKNTKITNGKKKKHEVPAKKEEQVEQEPKMEEDFEHKDAKKNSRNPKKSEEIVAAIEPPKKKGRAATKKEKLADNANSEVTAVDELKVVTKEKKPAKRGRAATAKLVTAVEETAPVNGEAEEVLPKKRSRKAPSVEKEIVKEKPKRGRAKKAADKEEEKIDDDAELKGEGEEEMENTTNGDANQEKAEDIEEIPSSSKKSEKETKPKAGSKAKGSRKRTAPTANNKKAAAKNLTAQAGSGGGGGGGETELLDERADNIELEDETDGSKTSKTKKSKTNTALLNSTVTTYNKEDFELPPPTAIAGQTLEEPRFNLKISSWNVAGLRSWVKKDGLKFLEYEQPDIFCLQETKCTNEQLPEEVVPITGYHPYWLCMPGGYAGVAIYSKIMPINVEYGIGNKDFDNCGRIITAEYEKFFLINAYVPNSGRKLVNLESRMTWEKLFQQFIQDLDARKPVVICGDMNVSHQEIDLANPKTNTRSAGFTKEEREKLTELLALGYIDSFRHLYPERKGAYTYWTYMANARSRNVGWRLDYFIVSERFIKRVVDNCIRSQCLGSDHCPITLFLKL